MEFDTIDDGLTVKAEPRFANFGNRLVAHILDMILVFAVSYIMSLFLPTATDFTFAAAVGILGMLYKPVMEAMNGAAVGKMVMKLKVVANEDGQVSWMQAFMRYIPWFIGGGIGLWFQYEMMNIPGLTEGMDPTAQGELMMEWFGANVSLLLIVLGGTLLPLISTLVMLGNKRNQSAHDILAETYVVHTKPA
ncbi:MAG: putative RDD family membrane protein YckC [Neolewinella sp.]|jgi:uncharacterized RDD family membrane protein YckC